MDMAHSDLMRKCLEEGDAATIRKLWGYVAPEMPQPATDAEATAIMHHARTQCEVVTFEKRAYSHCWLQDRGLPSGLPDHLKSKAERLYPRVVDAVGIACGAISEEMKPIAKKVQRAMEDVVAEHYASNIKDPKILRPRMMEARRRTIKQLLG